MVYKPRSVLKGGKYSDTLNKAGSSPGKGRGMKRIPKSVLKILVLAVALYVGGQAILLLVADTPPALAMSSKRPYIPCVSPVRVKIGSKIFSLPESGKVRPMNIRPGMLEDLCHAAQPLELHSLSVSAKYSLFLEGTEKEFDTKGTPLSQKSLTLSIANGYPPTHKEFHTLAGDLKKLMQLLNTKLSDLPMEDGFYAWKREDRPILRYTEPPLDREKVSWAVRGLHNRHNIYISDDPDLLSSTGEPAIFACERRFKKSKELDYEVCWSSIWDGEVKFAMWDVTRPKREWKALYKKFLMFRESLLSETGPKAPK